MTRLTKQLVDRERILNFRNYGNVYLRLALAVAFLIGVADRLELLGPPGQASTLGSWMGTPSWGNFGNFEIYTGQVGSFLPSSIIPLASLLATVAEGTFGLTLFFGLLTRWAAVGAGMLLFGFGTSMAISLGLESPFSYSVYSASAGAFVLATSESYSWSIDAILNRRRIAANGGSVLAGGLAAAEDKVT
jgi:putative oxidoreductase